MSNGAGGEGTGNVPAPVSSLPPGGRINVIYCRFSSDLQRIESNADQERRCRDGLARLGIPHEDFVVLADEAVRGTLESRPAFDRLKEMIYANRIGIVVVTEQSRLSRGDNVKSLLKDLVYHGGRFISIAEGIDTTHKGWKMIVGISEIHHSRANEDTAERVRGGQEGRVRDGNGSAGDYSYGYASEYVDPVAAAQYRGRGPKPKRHVIIDEAAAAVVRQIFAMFAIEGLSISAIVRWWEARKEQFPKITRTRIHHQHVRRILSNPKYVGIWRFGQTTTVQDGRGNKKQVAVGPEHTVTCVERPSLRIIDQALWDKAQGRLAKLKEIHGRRPHGRKRGPAQYYKLLYEKSLLGGLITCGCCGARMIVLRGGVKRVACPNHALDKCTNSTGVPVAQAEKAILAIIEQALRSYPQWMQAVAEATRRELERMAKAMPDERTRLRDRLADLGQRIDNLTHAIEMGGASATLNQRLAKLEGEKASVEAALAQLDQVETAAVQIPSDQWIGQQLSALASLLETELHSLARHIRPMLGRVVAEPVIAPGKKRGYARLRFTLRGWATLSHLLADKLPPVVASSLAGPSLPDESPPFVIELGAPTQIDRWAKQVVEWRRQNVTWPEIVRRTGLSLGSAWTAYQRGLQGEQAA